MNPHSTSGSAPTATPAPLTGEARAQAERFRDGFTALLAREAAALESPSSQELLAAVDGELDPEAAELWQERLALDARLAARVADLERFRAELDSGQSASSAAAARLLPFRRPARTSYAVWVAAAAVLLLALGIQLAPRLSSFSERTRAEVPARLDWAPEPLFADGFEAGDASNWSSTTPAG